MRLQRYSTGERFGVTPTDLVGAGGEARVYVLPPDQRLAAKVYHRPTESQYRKLRVMLANPPEDPAKEQAHISIAWPVDLLSMAYGERGFAGYLMPRVTEMRPLFQVYNPSVRRRDSRLVDYLFLHRAARNLAAAVRADTRVACDRQPFFFRRSARAVFSLSSDPGPLVLGINPFGRLPDFPGKNRTGYRAAGPARWRLE